MAKLALLGGKKVRSNPFPRYNSIGPEEKAAVARVMDSGVLSKYLGSWGEDFLGGPEVLAFEREWARKFSARHAIAVNSNSSGIHAALGACGVGPGDEVIVSPFSMAVSASAPLVWNAIPVFADVDSNHFNITPESFRAKITGKTRALVVVHLFGCPADMDEIMAIARERGIRVIEDCAQAPGATYRGRQVGTLGDVGVFSLNYHKHIHTGEGGVCTTNDDRLAERIQLIRNHAEAVVGAKGETDLENMIGFNFRLTEIQAAIGLEQLKKLDREVAVRQAQARIYDSVLSEFDFNSITIVKDRTHVYYNQTWRYDAGKTGVPRERFLEAIRAELEPVEGRESEGIPVVGAYVRPLYLLPMFQKKTAYRGGYPFTGRENYAPGVCPTVERLHFSELWLHDFTRSPLSEDDVASVAEAYAKVCSNIAELR